MKRFSQRYGFRQVRDVIQTESMDQELRNRLWDVAFQSFFERLRTPVYDTQEEPSEVMRFLPVLWHEHLKRPSDTIPQLESQARKQVREYFFACEWYEVYDFIEFLGSRYPDDAERRQFIEQCNGVLKDELSGYRFVGASITPITTEEEIAEVEDALATTGPFAPVAQHLKRALELLSDRKNPDYRNSIKESISAVEALCGLVTGESTPTLGHCLKELEKHVDLHGALRSAFEKLYGYTSDAEGIRHALLDQPRLDFEDAKFMLVACSAFVNYLKAKLSKPKS